MRLVGTVTTPGTLTPGARDRMFDLLAQHFEGVSRPTFDRDLAEKQWVVMLRDQQTGELQGFSTLMILDAIVQGTPIRAMFSGDTIVHRDYWGEPELATVWGNFVLSLIGTQDGVRFYWFLISKGYRTYKFLPVYFERFYPRHDQPTPKFEADVLRTLAERKFPGLYRPERGVIRFEKRRDRLKPDLAGVNDLRLADPHIRFFLERNPGYINGDELACVAELSEDNLRPIARRILTRAARSAPSS
ncbi:MAG: hypothetical protein FJZ01_01025 [Candidatus Sericytochromatia bacterium]|nr:hypothetical protein [Candidatus Tanganyikabacteria bacterium]